MKNNVKLKISPRLMLAFSMAVFGTLGIFTRNINVSSGELALYRAMLAALLIIIYFAATGQRPGLRDTKREIPLLILSGFAMGINWILLFEAYKYTTVSKATLSYYFAPVIVTAVSPFLFRERMTAKKLLCFVMSSIGLVMIIGTGEGAGGSDLKGIFFGLGAAFFYSAVMILNKLIKNTEGIRRTLLQFIAAIIILCPYVALSSGINIMGLGAVGIGCLLTVGLVHTGFTYCLYFSALKELKGQEAAILSYIDPLVAMLVSVFILGESMSLMQAVGGAMILGFTLLNELLNDS